VITSNSKDGYNVAERTDLFWSRPLLSTLHLGLSYSGGLTRFISYIDTHQDFAATLSRYQFSKR
jgi:hypothetical protein